MIPALILAVLFVVYIVVRCRLNPALAPPYDAGELSWRERVMPFLKYVLPLMSIFVVVVGSIVGGFATPTESAALGAMASLAAAALYRRLTWTSFLVAMRQTLRFTVMTLFIICGSVTFSQILAFSEASIGLASVAIGADLAPLAVLVGMLAVLMLLGCFMDQVSMMMITVPLFLPLVEAIGYDTIASGVLILMVLEISLATPPSGLLLFVIRGAAPESTTTQQIIGSVAPFIGLALAVVALLIAFPQLTLFLPGLIGR